jgi:hypothetical protein
MPGAASSHLIPHSTPTTTTTAAPAAAAAAAARHTLALHGARLEPNEPCSLQTLRALGVLSWKLDADKWENDPQLEAIRKVRGYSYTVSNVVQQYCSSAD